MFSNSTAFLGRTKDGRLAAGLWKDGYDYECVLLRWSPFFVLVFLR